MFVLEEYVQGSSYKVKKVHKGKSCPRFAPWAAFFRRFPATPGAAGRRVSQPLSAPAFRELLVGCLKAFERTIGLELILAYEKAAVINSPGVGQCPFGVVKDVILPLWSRAPWGVPVVSSHS